MNTYMWQHPLTQEHLQRLHSLKYIQIPPVSKTLACGDCGKLWLVEIVLIFIRENKIPGVKVLGLLNYQSNSPGWIRGCHSYTCSWQVCWIHERRSFTWSSLRPFTRTYLRLQVSCVRNKELNHFKVKDAFKSWTRLYHLQDCFKYRQFNFIELRDFLFSVTGIGAMAEIPTIIETVLETITEKRGQELWHWINTSTGTWKWITFCQLSLFPWQPKM